MDLGPSFRKFRAVAFSECLRTRARKAAHWLAAFVSACISVISFVWTILICVVMYMHWDGAGNTQGTSVRREDGHGGLDVLLRFFSHSIPNGDPPMCKRNNYGRTASAVSSPSL